MNIGRLFLLTLLIATPTWAQTEKTELVPGALMEAALENAAGSSLMGEYTYRLKVTQRQLIRSTPTIGSAVYETYAPTVKLQGETKFVLIKIEENGAPVSARKVLEERQQKSEELARLDEEARQQNVAATPTPASGSAKTAYFTIVGPTGIKLSVETVIRNSEFVMLRIESVDGRPTAVLSFRLKPDSELDFFEQWLLKVSGLLWIDLADKVLIRLSAWAQDDAAQKSKPVARYESRLMPDGQWLPREGQINAINNAAVFGSLNTDLTMVFSKYERNIQDVKITSPQRKP
ncbi:MAG TPA: hypothetical protein VFZ34_10455 [Blastocatellia bacterium]|nr:hypothetical protein [Blastocatellia bacterium]